MVWKRPSWQEHVLQSQAQLVPVGWVAQGAPVVEDPPFDPELAALDPFALELIVADSLVVEVPAVWPPQPAKATHRTPTKIRVLIYRSTGVYPARACGSHGCGWYVPTVRGVLMFRRVATLLFAGAMMVALLPSSGASSEDIEQRGCCSHHGGVAGGCCGRTLRCNDGSCSPTCGC